MIAKQQEFSFTPVVLSSDSFMIPSWHCSKLFPFLRVTRIQSGKRGLFGRTSSRWQRDLRARSEHTKSAPDWHANGCSPNCIGHACPILSIHEPQEVFSYLADLKRRRQRS